MRFFHLSDLHIGLKLLGRDLMEDQVFILNQIAELARRERPDAIVIAGDIYDKPVPSAEAVAAFDGFIASLAEAVPSAELMLVSGNHDSAQRLNLFRGVLNRQRIHMIGLPPLSPEDRIDVVTLPDAYGEVDFYLLPFVKPAHVRRFFPDEKIESYTDAIRVVVDALEINRAERNILVTHQFITGAARSDSEEISVGGTDNVDASVFDGFDYVALGHIHGPQNIGSARIRYCGTPLKYSFSEAKHEKSVTVIEMEEKESLSVRTVPLHTLRDLREIEGTYEELTYRPNYEGTAIEDYLHITLTDEEDIPDAIGKLRLIYPNLMCLDYNNSRTRAAGMLSDLEDLEHKSPLVLFGEFYQQQNGRPMSDEQEKFTREIMEKIWEEKL